MPGLRALHLLDLSLAGAQIGHLGLLRFATLTIAQHAALVWLLNTEHQPAA